MVEWGVGGLNKSLRRKSGGLQAQFQANSITAGGAQNANVAEFASSDVLHSN